MKKLLIGLVVFGALLIGALTITSGSGGYSAGDTLVAGTYIFGEDVKANGYMYQLTGPGEITIATDAGEEAYYSKLEEGESVHEHYLPVERGDTITITEQATLQLI